MSRELGLLLNNKDNFAVRDLDNIFIGFVLKVPVKEKLVEFFSESMSSSETYKRFIKIPWAFW